MFSNSKCVVRKRASTLSAVSMDEILKNLKSEEEVFQIWAINQLPPIGHVGAARTTASAFEYINAIILSKDSDFHKTVQQAITRELRHNVLKSEERIRVLLPFLIKMCRSTGKKAWMDLIRQLSRTIRDPIQQTLAFDQLSPIFLLDHSHAGTECAIHMLTGLCESGATMPADLINTVLQQPIALQQFLPQFINCILTTQSDTFIDSILERIVKSPISQAALFNAAIKLQDIPDILMKQVKMILNLPAHSQDLAATIAQNYHEIIDKGLAKPKTLLQIIWKSKLFVPMYYDVVADFFLNTLDIMSTKDTILFLKKICNSKSPRANWLIKNVIQNSTSKETTSYVVPYLCSNLAFSNLDSWINAVTAVMPVVNSDDATKLTNFIIKRCKEEIDEGHVSTLPIDQQTVLQTNTKLPLIIRVSGSTQIAKLLNTLALSPCMHILATEGIELIKSALKKHSYPLVLSIAAILRKLAPRVNDVLDFINYIYGQNSTYKIIFLKLMPEIIHSFDKGVIINCILPKYMNLLSGDVPSTVQCVAIKTIPVLNNIGSVITTSPIYKDIYKTIKGYKESKDQAIIDAIKAVKKDVDAFMKLNDLISDHRASRRQSLPKSAVKSENIDPNVTVKQKKRTSLLVKGQKQFDKTSETCIVRPDNFKLSTRRQRSSSFMI